MAKRKTTRKKKGRRKAGKKKLFKSSLRKAFLGLGGLFILVVLAGVLTHYLMVRDEPQRPRVSPKKPVSAAKKSITKAPAFEIYPQKEIPPLKKPLKKPLKTPPQKLSPAKKSLPLVAIIIDDLGYDKKLAEKFSRLKAKITFSILPHSPHQKSIAQLTSHNGLETMLHLPMEPIEFPNVDPGPGALLTSMSPDDLVRQLEENLKAVPGVKGVNNHMGSKMTATSSSIYQIFTVLKKRNLYFVDSRTSPQTLCKPSARLFQIPFAQRDIFIDHRQEARFIRRQLKELIRIAQHNGYAVGIGHPHLLTYEILREMLPELQKSVQLVPASDIVHIIG